MVKYVDIILILAIFGSEKCSSALFCAKFSLRFLMVDTQGPYGYSAQNDDEEIEIQVEADDDDDNNL